MKRETAICICGLGIAFAGLLADLDTLFGFGCGLCAGFGLACMEQGKERSAP